jgi:Rod binding domain-containing protein
MEITGIPPVSMLAPTPDAKRTAEAAQEFEALLIGQMLKSARESGSGSWLSSEEDASSSPAVEFAEQQQAVMMAKSGGLGLAKAVQGGLLAAHNASPAQKE